MALTQINRLSQIKARRAPKVTRHQKVQKVLGVTQKASLVSRRKASRAWASTRAEAFQEGQGQHLTIGTNKLSKLNFKTVLKIRLIPSKKKTLLQSQTPSMTWKLKAFLTLEELDPLYQMIHLLVQPCESMGQGRPTTHLLKESGNWNKNGKKMK